MYDFVYICYYLVNFKPLSRWLTNDCSIYHSLFPLFRSWPLGKSFSLTSGLVLIYVFFVLVNQFYTTHCAWCWNHTDEKHCPCSHEAHCLQIGAGEDEGERGRQADSYTITYCQCSNGIINISGKQRRSVCVWGWARCMRQEEKGKQKIRKLTFPKVLQCAKYSTKRFRYVSSPK